MSTFFENARSIFEAAESASRAGQVASDLTILVGADGGIRMIADSDWPLDRLLAHNGGRTAYRVREQAGRLRVEGRSGGAACRLESDSPRSVAHALLHAQPTFVQALVPAPASRCATPALIPAGTWLLPPAASD